MSIRDALQNTRGVWLRQLSDVGEADFDAVITTLQQYVGGKIVLYPKVMDGTTWQGQIDPKTPIKSLADVQALLSLCVSRGIGCVPVVVPRGVSGEAVAHAQIAIVAGCGCFDIEQGPGFWDSSPLAGIPAYWQALRQAAPTAYLINQPDPRNLSSTFVQQCAPLVDAISGQHYVGWQTYGVDVLKEFDRFDAIAALGRDLLPILWGVGDWRVVDGFWRGVAGQCLGVSAFSFGPMNGAQLEALGALQFPPAAEDCSAVASERDRFRQALSNINAEVVAALGPAGGS